MIRPITIHTNSGPQEVLAEFNFTPNYAALDEILEDTTIPIEMSSDCSQIRVMSTSKPGATGIWDKIHYICTAKTSFGEPQKPKTEPGTAFALTNWGTITILPDPAPQITQQQLREFLQGE